MIKYNKQCKVCQEIKKDKKLLEEIYASTAFDRSSTISLQSISDRNHDKFSYDSIRNHVKKHQAITAEDLSEKHMQKIVKKAEQNILKKRIESSDIWTSILDKGHEQLEEGTIRLRAGDVLRAAKDKSDYELKVKDQELAMIEMVYHFASGENNAPIKGRVIDPEGKIIDADTTGTIIEAETVPDIDPTQELAGDLSEGENGPSGVHYPPSWDAAT
jgi:hypothetical protein